MHLDYNVELEKGGYQVFVDGSTGESYHAGKAGFAAIVVLNDQIIDSYSHQTKTTVTNNAAEFLAIIAGIHLAPKDCDVTLFSDSQYCVNSLTKWWKRWEQRGWCRKKNHKIKNLKLIQTALNGLQQKPRIKLCWIKGHAGYKWNELADSMAKSAKRTYLKTKEQNNAKSIRDTRTPKAKAKDPTGCSDVKHIPISPELATWQPFEKDTRTYADPNWRSWR